MASAASRFRRIRSDHLGRWFAGAALLLAPPAVVGAQIQPIPRGTSAEVIVASAETEGRLYQRTVDARDSVARSCATGWDIGPARSGEFTIGGQISSLRPLRAGKVGKIWWKPLKAAADMPALVIRGRNLSNTRDTVRYRTTRIAWSGSPGTPVPPSQRSYFFPSGFSVPTAGRWLVVATSGANWGCFIVTAV